MNFFRGTESDRVAERASERGSDCALASAISPDQTLLAFGCRQVVDGAHWPPGTQRVVFPFLATDSRCSGATLVVITSIIRPLPRREYLHREDHWKYGWMRRANLPSSQEYDVDAQEDDELLTFQT